nr:MAG TPA: hypothetical protein [Caudoviricetes sp.]
MPRTCHIFLPFLLFFVNYHQIYNCHFLYYISIPLFFAVIPSKQLSSQCFISNYLYLMLFLSTTFFTLFLTVLFLYSYLLIFTFYLFPYLFYFML